MKFDVVLTNPPFQDRTNRKRTPHKLWIDFTERAFSQWLKPGGLLLQVSPASFQSPSNRILKLMRSHITKLVNFDVGHHFPGVASTFAYYAIQNKTAVRSGATRFIREGTTYDCPLTADILWLPTDLNELSLSIHRKVMFSASARLDVQHDYVTCHNITLGKTLSKTQDAHFCNPVFHTNPQTWYTSLHQGWATKPKVMWTRSGYTKPFFDPGVLGGTDMVYYVPVCSADEGQVLQHNLTLPLFQYIFRSAKWSGFGNEVVFSRLPDLPRDKKLTHEEVCDLFDLTNEEAAYVRRYVG